MGSLWKVTKWVLGIGFILLLVCGGGAAFLYPRIKTMIDEQKLKGMGTAVITEASSRGTLVRVISAPGTVTPTLEVNISARVSAKIANLPFKEGDQVKQGDVVVELDSKDLAALVAASEARLLAAQADLKGAEAQYLSEEAAMLGVKSAFDKATSDWERQQELFTTGDISKAELDNFKAELDRTKSQFQSRTVNLQSVRATVEAVAARVKIAEADLTQSRENLLYGTIRAPIDGYITQLNAKVGEVVVVGTMNNAGTVIMKIADLSEMLVKARLAEIDTPRVKEGQRVQVVINGYGDRKFEGTLRRVALQSKVNMADQTGYFEGEVLLLLNGERVFAGLTASVDIEVESLDNVVMVPSQAVLDKRVEELPKEIRESPMVDRDKTFAQVVFIKKDGKAKLTPVKAGPRNITKTAIEQGLEENVEIIVGPFKALQELTDNANVRLQDDNKKEMGEEKQADSGGPPGNRQRRRGG
ncbi:MAG: efflux RND transporter periplasmic adaptor subunit [Phycisphaerales bacterium]